MTDTILVDSAMANARCIHQNGDRQQARPRYVRWSSARGGFSSGFPKDTPIWFTDGHLGMAELGHRHDYKTVGLLLEPPHLHPENYQQANDVLASGLLDVLYTHHPEAFSLSYAAVRAYPFGGTRIHESDWRIHPKTVWAPSMVYSGKDTLPGHKLRHEVAAAKQDVLSLYGPQVTGQFLDHKIVALRDYAFSVAIENVNTGVWFTEALLDCLLTGTVPIWWGSHDALLKWGFDQAGIVWCDSLDALVTTIDHLADPRVAKATYQHMRSEIQHNFIKAHEYTCTEDWLWQRDPTLFAKG